VPTTLSPGIDSSRCKSLLSKIFMLTTIGWSESFGMMSVEGATEVIWFIGADYEPLDDSTAFLERKFPWICTHPIFARLGARL